MNVADEDGETPLFVVETIEVARYLVEHGADVDHRNNDGESVRTLNDDVNVAEGLQHHSQQIDSKKMLLKCQDTFVPLVHL